MDSSLRERFARLAQTRALEHVPSGSPVGLILRPAADRASVQSIPAISALVRRGVGVLKAKRAVEECLDAGRAFVHVPKVEDKGRLAAELAGNGIRSSSVARATIDVRALRERLGLTQEQFALRYGLDANSVQNWESGRRKPDAAVRSYLAVIERIPDRVGDALEEALPVP